MANHCSDFSTCPNGNCVGCKNGSIWCQDPRCAPFCAQCSIQADHDHNANILVVIILICLTVMLFIVWFLYGPEFFEHHDDHIRANVIVPERYLTQSSIPQSSIPQSSIPPPGL